METCHVSVLLFLATDSTPTVSSTPTAQNYSTKKTMARKKQRNNCYGMVSSLRMTTKILSLLPRIYLQELNVLSMPYNILVQYQNVSVAECRTNAIEIAPLCTVVIPTLIHRVTTLHRGTIPIATVLHSATGIFFHVSHFKSWSCCWYNKTFFFFLVIYVL